MRVAATIMIGAILWGSGAMAAVKTTNGSGAVIRTLDRITGLTQDFEMISGSSVEQGFLRVSLKQCRYPRRAIDREAFAQLLVEDKRLKKPAFEGWMVATSPALSALEHPRYDVWVLRCLAPK